MGVADTTKRSAEAVCDRHSSDVKLSRHRHFELEDIAFYTVYMGLTSSVRQ